MRSTITAQIEEENELQVKKETDFAVTKVQMMDAMDKAIQLKVENRLLCEKLEAYQTESENYKKTIRELERKNAFLQGKADRFNELEKRLDALENHRPAILHNNGCQNFYGDISLSDFSNK